MNNTEAEMVTKTKRARVPKVANHKGVSLDSETYDSLRDILNDVLKKRICGRKPTYNDVVKYSLSLLKNSDFDKILENCLTSKDKLIMKHQRHIEKTGEDISFHDFLLMKVKH